MRDRSRICIRSESRFAILIGVIILLQVIMIVLTGINKTHFFIDETYSYILSNSYDADKISTADWMWGDWVTEKDFDEFITVQEGEQFSFSSVYKNNSTDCHPPLYYWALHSVCSFFPNSFSKWFGIAINILCFVITGYFLWLISKRTIDAEKFKLLPLILYGFSWLALDTCIFIRMYMMLTMFTVIFSYIQMQLLQDGYTVKRIIFNAIIIYLGAMTQYYFIVFAFFAVLILTLYWLLKKRIKQAFVYGGTSLFSVLLMVISYPYVLTQATGSSTNNIGTEITKNLFNFKLWIKQIVFLGIDTADRLAYKRIITVVVVAFFAVVALCILLHAIKKREALVITQKKNLIWLLAVLASFYLAITFIGGDYVYVRYIYMIIPLCYLLVVMLLDILMNKYPKLQMCTLIIAIVFALLNSVMLYKNNSCEYLCKYNEEQKQQLIEYEDEGLLVFVKEKEPAIPVKDFWIYKSFDSVYMDTADNIEKERVFEECLENDTSFTVFIARSGYWVDGFKAEELLKKYKSNIPFEYDLLTKTDFGNYYHISSN